MDSFVTFFLLATLAAVCAYPIPDFKKHECPAPATVDDVDIPTYFNGLWYQLAVSKTFYETFERKSGVCTVAEYTFPDEKGLVKVNNTGRASRMVTSTLPSVMPNKLKV